MLPTLGTFAASRMIPRKVARFASYDYPESVLGDETFRPAKHIMMIVDPRGGFQTIAHLEASSDSAHDFCVCLGPTTVTRYNHGVNEGNDVSLMRYIVFELLSI